MAWLHDELVALDASGLRRGRRILGGPQSVQVVLDGRPVVNFGSNDYLALASDPRMTAAAAQATERYGWGSGASPLVCGNTGLHEQLERRIAEFEGCEAALVFSSGYAANVGTIVALADRNDAIFGDEKNHASIIDGCRLSRAEVHVYPHRDCRVLESMLDRAAHYRRRLIVTDSLFSMDGDLAPLAELADLADRYQAMLLVDEAHGTGVFGRQGRGVAEQLGVHERIDVHIGTLSKALGSAGGFVAGRRSLVEYLVSRARTYIFSTAVPAAACAAALAALEIVEREPERRRALLDQAARLREELRRMGWNVGASASQIIPIVVGEANRAMELAQSLLDRGFFVPGIRPPSVPQGQSLLRLSLSAGHTPEMVEGLAAALRELAA